MDPIIHEDYQSEFQYNNDIALLKLAEDVDTNIHTPACLAPTDADYTGQNGRVYGEHKMPTIPYPGSLLSHFLSSSFPGWGSTASCPATNQMTLLEVELTIISDSECAAQTSSSVTYTNLETGECVTDASSYQDRISDQMLCAGASGKDSCQASAFQLHHNHDDNPQGDSGGPFTVKNRETNKHDLVGVVSWGDGCAAVRVSWC